MGDFMGMAGVTAQRIHMEQVARNQAHYARRVESTTAYSVLGIEPGATEEEVRAAFAAAVKADHPDNGGTGKRITDLKKARDYLLSAPKNTTAPLKTVCKMCGGKGTVPHGMESRQCSSCGGTGATVNAG